MKFGFLRETQEMAEKAGISITTGLPRTGLEEYLKVIFPEINDWVHDKPISQIIVDGKKCKYRPDYISESLKLIIEFDGIQHFTSPINIQQDFERTKFYEKYGYQVIRIPFFIQLSNKVVKRLFKRDCVQQLFSDEIPSLSIEEKTTPAFMCLNGIELMHKYFLLYSPEQYETNISYLESLNNEELTAVSILKNPITSFYNLEQK